MSYKSCLSDCRVLAGQFMQRLDDAIMPLRCVFCGTRTRHPERDICHGCREELPWCDSACQRCAEPVPSELPAGVFCPACQKRPPPLVSVVAPLRYEFPVDAGLKALKFRRKLYYGAAFGHLLCASLHRLPADIDVLLPVPLHWRRLTFRGFNQANEISRPVVKHSMLPILSGVVRQRATPFQSGLGRKERGENLRQAFAVRRKLKAHHVLIVDDVITTGETVRRLAETLLRAGAGKVSALAVARAVSPV